MKQPGWYGLTPGRSTINDAMMLLGEPSSISEFVNGKSYDFFDGYVRISVLYASNVISKIRLATCPGKLGQSIIPADIEALTSLYGEIPVVAIDPREGLRLEGPGLRALLDPDNKPEKVIWLEIYQCN